MLSLAVHVWMMSIGGLPPFLRYWLTVSMLDSFTPTIWSNGVPLALSVTGVRGFGDAQG